MSFEGFGGVLADRDISALIEKKKIKVVPLFKGAIQPASVDLHLDKEYVMFKGGAIGFVDTRKPVDRMMKKTSAKEFVIYPNQLVLACTYETIKIPDFLVGRLEGKSSLARLGLLVHATAGYIDPGNELKITLELYNISALPIKLYYKMPIAQIAFTTMTSKVINRYGNKKLNSKYYKAKGVQVSKSYKNFRKVKK